MKNQAAKVRPGLSNKNVRMKTDDALMILYIEDNSDNLKLISRVLTAYGFNIHGVTDGQAAFSFLEENTPDLILIDINLPGLDGYTITRQLRQMERFAHTPIIALTANVMKADRDKSIEAGCNGFIQKPVDVDALPGQIHHFLTQTSTPSSKRRTRSQYTER
jgi:two-component system, cell cycle response regulator DivK